MERAGERCLRKTCVLPKLIDSFRPVRFEEFTRFAAQFRHHRTTSGREALVSLISTYARRHILASAKKSFERRGRPGIGVIRQSAGIDGEHTVAKMCLNPDSTRCRTTRLSRRCET